MSKPLVRTQKGFLLILLAAALMVSLYADARSSASQKMMPEELVAKHLASIGTAKARASINTRIIAGTSLVIFRTPPPGQATGRAVMASQGSKNLIGMSFPNPVYPREQLGFDGSSFVAAYVTPGNRSALGNFLMTHQMIFKEGLMGGTLSTAWPLSNLAERRPQLEYVGQRKRDKRLLHELKYRIRGGSDLQVSLFFDTETYQHLATEYERVIPAPTGSVSYSTIEEREIRYKMVEEFIDFRNEGGLILPHTYRIKLSVDSQGGTFLADWEIKLTKFAFDEPIDPASFTISGD